MSSTGRSGRSRRCGRRRRCRWCWRGGWRRRSGRRGGAMLGTLADAYANPIMVDALILGREGTIVVPRSDPQLTYAPGIADGIDDPTQMERWEPWVRAYTAIGEMLQGINFRRTSPVRIPGPGRPHP